MQYHNLTWDDCSMVVGLENDMHMCQWAIASVPGHPVLRATLQRALRSLQQGMKCADKHVVHTHTGPGIWTAGLRDALGLTNASYTAADVSRAVWTDPVVYRRARSMRLCVVAPDFLGQPGSTPAQNAQNHYSSQWGDAAPNKPWIVERDQLAKAVSNTSATEKQRVAAAESKVSTD